MKKKLIKIRPLRLLNSFLLEKVSVIISVEVELLCIYLDFLDIFSISDIV